MKKLTLYSVGWGLLGLVSLLTLFNRWSIMGIIVAVVCFIAASEKLNDNEPAAKESARDASIMAKTDAFFREFVINGFMLVGAAMVVAHLFGWLNENAMDAGILIFFAGLFMQLAYIVVGVIYSIRTKE